MAWTEEREGRVKELAAKHWPASAIAKDLGVTRNTVVGKLRRLGLRCDSTGLRPKISRNERRRQRRAEKAARRVIKPDPRLPVEALPAVTAEDAAAFDAAIPVEQRRQLVELGAGMCRFAVGDVGDRDFFFCGGEAVPGLPYCPHHAKRCYRF